MESPFNFVNNIISCIESGRPEMVWEIFDQSSILIIDGQRFRQDDIKKEIESFDIRMHSIDECFVSLFEENVFQIIFDSKIKTSEKVERSERLFNISATVLITEEKYRIVSLIINEK